MPEHAERMIEAILDVIAPKREEFDNERFAIFEWGHETTPTNKELRGLAEDILTAVERQRDV